METMVTSGSIERFLDWLSDRGKSSNTIRAYRADLAGLLDHTSDHPAEEFDDRAARYLTEYRDTIAPKTTRRRLSTFRAYAKWAGIGDVLSDYRAPTPAKQQPHPLPEGVKGVLAMLDKCRYLDEANLVVLTGLAGLRVHEAITVTTDHVDFSERTLKVMGKGSKERIVPLSRRALEALARRCIEAHVGADKRLVRMADRTARRTLTRLGREAGLRRNVASHDMRATFATEAYNKTGDLRAVQELLGHSDSRTTEIYTGISMDAMRNAAEIGDDEDVA